MRTARICEANTSAFANGGNDGFAEEIHLRWMKSLCDEIRKGLEAPAENAEMDD